MKISFNYKNRKINVDAKKCSSLGMVRGLMFRRRQNAPALLFDFKKPARTAIHSCFVFFPFWAVFLDGEDKIVEEKIVKPWRLRVAPKKSFYRLVEIPVSKRYGVLLPTGIRKV